MVHTVSPRDVLHLPTKTRCMALTAAPDGVTRRAFTYSPNVYCRLSRKSEQENFTIASGYGKHNSHPSPHETHVCMYSAHHAHNAKNLLPAIKSPAATLEPAKMAPCTTSCSWRVNPSMAAKSGDLLNVRRAE